MSSKKFTGRKMRADELSIHIYSEADEGRVLLNDEDTVLAPILKKFVDNDIQRLIMGFIGEVNAPITCDHDDHDDYDYDYDHGEENYDDDFVIDEKERIQERYEAQIQRYEAQIQRYEAQTQRYEVYEW
jgi:hypothetical protein